MARIINSADIDAAAIAKMSNRDMDWIYNGLDCCVTYEVREKIEENFDEASKLVFNFEQGMCAPLLEATTTGILIDAEWRNIWINRLEGENNRLQANLDKIATAVWGKGLNPLSPKQMQEFFHGVMKLPEKRRKDKKSGKYKVILDRDQLENLYGQYFYSRPIINHILAIKDRRKQLGVLRTAVDSDGRLRSGYNPAATDTGRVASRANAFGTGTNGQNITERLRRMFIADPRATKGKFKGRKMKLAYIDLEQAESRVVGLIVYLLFGDKTYLDACESGDLHTTVCQMVWPELNWKGILKDDKKTAEQIFYRDFSYRDMAKRGGHGTNYYGKPATMAMHLKIDSSVMERFQPAYFNAFPGIQDYHKWVISELQRGSMLTTVFGRKRIFFDRTSQESTWRKAIAHLPQSIATGDYLNIGLYRVWSEGICQILGQIHDAIIIQYPEDEEEAILTKVAKLLEVRLRFGDLEFLIPNEVQTGWNLSKYLDEVEAAKKKRDINVDGLKKWKGTDERKRQYFPKSNLLDNIIC